MKRSNKEERIYYMCADLFKTLANPTRLMILDLLKEGEKSVNEIAKLTGRRQSNISQHLTILKQMGMVTARREKTNTYYRVTSSKVIQLCHLIREVLYEVLKEGEEIAKSIHISKPG